MLAGEGFGELPAINFYPWIRDLHVLYPDEPQPFFHAIPKGCSAWPSCAPPIASKVQSTAKVARGVALRPADFLALVAKVLKVAPSVTGAVKCDYAMGESFGDAPMTETIAALNGIGAGDLEIAGALSRLVVSAGDTAVARAIRSVTVDEGNTIELD
jgi:hypothetical protein